MKMFPQSELDNYKLQVELLQEKLQRSEISRQQLEHKLDKILQKRDEHDKVVRSKARQKYQLFLEEQQRRNERNKQLVQMLERIEQQTEVMNARSERLKMMKLQYEMYFAKLVHSQTRRCIQNSINPMTQMMPTPSTQTAQATVLQPSLEGHNYDINMETSTPTMPFPYQSYASTSHIEKESLLRLQAENMAIKTTELPTLANFVTSSKKDCRDYRNFDAASTIQAQQPIAEYQLKTEPININNNIIIPENSGYYKQETSENNSYPQTNASISVSSVTDLLPNDKQFSEFKENSNLSTTASSIFEEIPNLAIMKQNQHNLSKFPNTIRKSSNNATCNNNDTLSQNENNQLLRSTQNMNENPLKSTNENDGSATSNLQNIKQNMKTLPQELGKELQSPIINNENKFGTHNVTMPNLNKKPLASLEIKASRNVIEASQNSSNETHYDNRKSKPNEEIENKGVIKNTESISSAASVSIENIENEIYGELLSPLETAQIQKPQSPNVAPELLENLITEGENVGRGDILSEEPVVEYDSPMNGNPIENSTVTENNSQENSVVHNHEQAAAYNDYNNIQPAEELSNSFADYTNYENVEGSAGAEIQQEQKQQQQYDYSNYDPTQYSYPGYIYDETTGEYKPDPNAPADQYATDQQYTSESYDDQQYQQQNYDYIQSYAEDPNVTPTTAGTAYNNYDAQQQEISPNLVASENNEDNPKTIATIESYAPQPDLEPEEVNTTSTKVLKPTSILSTSEKTDTQKKKKRVNFIDSSETDESAPAAKGALPPTKATTGNISGSNESDFDFSSSPEAEPKAT